ncbi:Os06g0618050 [Oryza sativa Japonica Group]|uniref:Os06g0618050 protein n=1 Tax=Oryza sativa subsp. japonica TaxID=39947 RepID=A0A0P0WZ87_ORYSJ|nr:hypothetical protein EE612_035370 [Oryza sativa]BAS98637.1 Os06g0618050 [Oryza sativa Japonica Group]
MTDMFLSVSVFAAFGYGNLFRAFTSTRLSRPLSTHTNPPWQHFCIHWTKHCGASRHGHENPRSVEAYIEPAQRGSLIIIPPLLSKLLQHSGNEIRGRDPQS